ncbi:MAG: carboxypeptidase-like regulatory domain-containing protein [Planctomycetota bacterium]
MSTTPLRIVILLLLLGAAASLPLWWERSPEQDPANTAVEAGAFEEDGARVTEQEAASGLARESLTLEPTLHADGSEEVVLRPSRDGLSRIHIQLDGFEKSEHQWLQANARETQTDVVARGRIKGARLSVEVDPGSYRVHVTVGSAPRRASDQATGVRILGTSEQDFPERAIRVPEGQEATLVYRPLATGTVFGVVKRGSVAAADAKVQLAGERTVMVKTDAEGRFRFENVPVGRRTVRLGRPFLNVVEHVVVEDGGEHEIALQSHVSGFQVEVRQGELDIPLGNAKVQVRFYPAVSASELAPTALRHGAIIEAPQLLPTGPDGKTPVMLTGPGKVEYTVFGPQNWGLAAEHGSFWVEMSGNTEHVVGLRGGAEVFVRREEGQAGRMTIAMFLTKDGVELGCGGIERLDDDSGYRVWGVPRAAGRLYLTRTRAKRMWIADIPESYDRAEVTAKEVSLIPVHVRSATYADGSSDAFVTLLQVRDAQGALFPIGPVLPRSFGLRATATDRMALRPAEVASLPPGKYTLSFLDRDNRVFERVLTLAEGTEKSIIDLRFKP